MDKIRDLYLKNNKKKLLEEIWITYHPKLQIYLKQIFPNIEDYEDRASEILMKVFNKIDKYNPDYAFSTWIYRVARNTQIDEIRKNTIRSYNIEDYNFISDSNPEDDIIRDFEYISIKEAIESLDSHERELIYLYYYEEQNYREISEITGIPTGTLKYRMSVSRSKLKEILERGECYETADKKLL